MGCITPVPSWGGRLLCICVARDGLGDGGVGGGVGYEGVVGTWVGGFVWVMGVGGGMRAWLGEVGDVRWLGHGGVWVRGRGWERG